MLSSNSLKRFLGFDEERGIVSCESGVSFEELLEVFVPRGWFPPVTPGTKFVTMGGAVAADVHGKNHHSEGSFGDYVLSIQLRLPSGEEVFCSRKDNARLFWATIGGMGLTGMIVSLSLQLKRIESAFIKMEAVRAPNLSDILALLDEFEAATYSMAWIDCLAGGKRMGRSILMKGEHATIEEVRAVLPNQNPLELKPKRKLAVPFDFPSIVLNTYSIKAFNFAYYHRPIKTQTHLTDYDSFFYPLDSIHHWNRIYGRKGFTQYQFVIPKAVGKEALSRILSEIGQAGLGSFLAVLKLLGKGHGLLSFPIEGYTLALDFPVNTRVFTLLNRLDKLVLYYGGRIYLAKDARMNAATFEKSYGELNEFRDILTQYIGTPPLSSLQSQRLNIYGK